MNNKFTFVLVLATFSAPYIIDTSTKFLITVPLLLLALRIHYGAEWRTKCGFFGTTRELFFGAAAVVGLFFLVRAGLSHASRSSEIQVVWSHELVKYAAPFAQVLGEEIVLRALLLRALMNRIHSAGMTSFAVAAFFSFTHAIVYKNLGHVGATALTPLCLFNLFLFGMIGNSIYLARQNIVLPYALHLGWNLARFTGSYSIGARALSEAESFNHIEGSTLATILLCLIGIGSLGVLRYSSLIKNRNTGAPE